MRKIIKKNPKNYECVERKPRGGVKLDLKTKIVWNECSLCLCMFPGSNMIFWAENWVKTGPKIAPSEFCRSRTSRDHVIQAFASSSVLPCHACASSIPLRHLCSFQSARSREPCVRVTSRWSSPQFLVFLPFLQGSFPISKSFMPYKA